MAPAGKLSARGTPLIARRARSPSPQPSAATRAEFKRSFAEAAGGGQPSSAGAASAAAPSAASKSAVISESKSTTQAQAEASETKKASISKDDDPFDENLIHEILAPTSTLGGLYLGNEMAARDEAALKSKSIGAVLNATIELKCSFPNTIKYYRARLIDNDSDGIGTFLVECNDFIHKHRTQKVNVFVHCAVGMSRSSSFVLAYLVRHCGYSLLDAYWHIKRRRHVVSPSTVFMFDLAKFEKQITGKATLDPQAYSKDRFNEPFSPLAMTRDPDAWIM